MDLNTHDTTGHGGGGNFITSASLLIMSGIFHTLQALSPADVYTWIFRGLSLISLGLVIYINWSKAVEIFKSKNKNR